MIYLNNTPCLYQPGDLVEATVTYAPPRKHGDKVRGIIVNWVNDDPMMLHRGRVQILTAHGEYVWAQVVRVVMTNGQRTHPAIAVPTRIAYYSMTCGCGETFYGFSPEQVYDQHRLHAEHANPSYAWNGFGVKGVT